jgi:WD40 repeat protein
MNLNGIIAIGSDQHDIRLCDIRTSGTLHSLIGHKTAVYSMDWSSFDDYMLISGSGILLSSVTTVW